MKEDLRGRLKRETLADFFARSPLRGLKIERFKEIAKPLDFENTPALLLNPWRKPQK